MQVHYINNCCEEYINVILLVCPWYRILFFFFFSSRRRHTRWTGDWSSDVCSSDLAGDAVRGRAPGARRRRAVMLRLAAAALWAALLVPNGAAAGLRQAGARPVVVEIGRASCRERVEGSVGAVSLNK